MDVTPTQFLSLFRLQIVLLDEFAFTEVKWLVYKRVQM
jgi:hypothetical protein